MTKQEIKEALKQGYKNLGLSEEAFDGVATLGETIGITEEQLDTFVQGAKQSLVEYQRKEDKIRDLAKKQITDPKDPDPKPQDPPKSQGLTKEDLAQAVASAVSTAVSAAIEPLQSKINEYEGSKLTESVISTVKSNIAAKTVSTAYKADMDEALETAIELYNAGGCTQTTEELEALVMARFNRSVSRRGGDVTSALSGAPSQEDDDAAFAEEMKSELARKREQGLIE